MHRKSFTFNGIRKPWIHMTRGRTKPLFSSIQRNVITVPGMAGAYLQSSEREVLEFEQPIAFLANSDEHALQLKDELAAWLYTDKPAPLTFDDEPDRTYYAVVQNTIDDFERIGRLRQGKIRFLCLDPYGYGPERSLIFPADIVSVENKGTAESDPIFELTAKKKTTFAMISNGDDDDAEYNLIGKPADVDEQVVDDKKLLIDERGDTLKSWTTAGTNVEGTVAGTLVPDGTGIGIGGYGTGERWHGPALLKEIPPIQDFEIEMRCRVELSKPDQTFRIEFYLFDENMNVLGKMALMDSSAANMQIAAEGRYGPFKGLHVNYPISSRNYLRKGKHFHGMLRMRRIGQRFEFYVARIGIIDDFTHHDTLTQIFNDISNQYQGRLKYVQIHIGKFAGTASSIVPRINAFKVYEQKPVTVDQTPYILYPGDVVTFDHKDDDILLNGEPRMDLKDFGGSFFKLQKGENRLIVTPEDSFDTKVKFQERFL